MSNGFAAARKTLEVHEHELKIAKQHLSTLSPPTYPDLATALAAFKGRAYAGSPRNMKVDRIGLWGALHNSYLCIRCLRV